MNRRAHFWAIVATAVVGTAVAVGIRDHRAWVALGEGGLPHTLKGWLTMTGLRLRGGDPFRVADPRVGSAPAHLALPPRGGPRPGVAPHPIPHRVVDQHADADLVDAEIRMLDEFLELAEPALEYRVSIFERNFKALFVAGPDLPHATARMNQGELGHVHRHDGSLHVTLSPTDAQHVIDAGWGELHPLSGRRAGLPSTYTLLYPPRNEADLEPIGAIVRAAIAFMSGVSPTP